MSTRLLRIETREKNLNLENMFFAYEDFENLNRPYDAVNSF